MWFNGAQDAPAVGSGLLLFAVGMTIVAVTVFVGMTIVAVTFFMRMTFFSDASF